MSYDKFLRESSGMGPVPGAKGGVRGRRTRGRKGFNAVGKGKDHFPSRQYGVRPPYTHQRQAKMTD